MFNSSFNQEQQERNNNLFATVIDLYVNKRLTVYEIAYKTKLSYYYVRKILIDNNIPRRKKNSR